MHVQGSHAQPVVALGAGPILNRGADEGFYADVTNQPQQLMSMVI